MADRLYLQTIDAKSSQYMLGQDVAKIARSTSKPQMWIESNHVELCMSTMEQGAQVDFPLSLYVPTDGGYNIYLESGATAATSVILMRNEEELWDLSRGSYVVQITHEGVSSNYRIRIKTNQPTEMPTTGADDETILVEKVLINGNVYILRGKQMYNLQGAKVK